MNNETKLKTATEEERVIRLVGTAGEVCQALKDKIKEKEQRVAEIKEVLDFQRDWHEYVSGHVGEHYWGNGNDFTVLDHNGEVEVYEMDVSTDPESGKKRYARKRKLLGCTKAKNGEILGYVLIKDDKCDWYRTAEELIEKHKKCATS